MDIKEVLNQYHSFQECILEEILCSNYARTWELKINYIWENYGTVRKELSGDPQIVTLRFGSVQEFHMKSALSDSMLLEPNQVGWGINEIANISLENNKEILAPYSSMSKPFYHVVLAWEGERKIDIVFSELSINDESR